MNLERLSQRLGVIRRGPAMVMIISLVALLLMPPESIARAAGSPAQDDRDGIAFFETEIRPLLVERCYSCHSDDAPRVRGGLKLDSAEGLRLGGDLGPSLVPGDPENSLLIEAVRYDDELLKMPPSGKLTDHQIEQLVRWVEMGAPDPRTDSAPASPDPSRGDSPDVDLWSFRPPTEPALPEVSDPSWPRSDLDRFILAALDAEGMSPAPPADRRTLIRRATFDLTGLPPTPGEIVDFLDDDAPDPEAFDRVIDRLLASPAYGERWGRHWLDVARYADSNGSDENVAHGHAWRYRDYVVDAFNHDLPYDQFVVEQIAGDQLRQDEETGPSHAQLIATGFLSLGPKVLAEPDQQKMEMDIIDEQLDTLGRAFLGLTIGCARCHDHKFDPISAADYYGLAGIFKSTQTMESLKTVARWYEHPIPAPDDLERQAEHEQAIASLENMINERVSQANARLIAEQGEGFTLPDDPEPLYPAELADELKRLRDDLKTRKESAPQLPSAMGVTDGTTIDDLAIHIRGSHLTLGEVVPRGVPEAIPGPASPEFDSTRSGRLALARWIVDEGNPLTSRVMVNRVWRWHMGRGIVTSTDNFGVLGSLPTHPGLLDWLSLRFMEDGWSVKALHRRIMGSRTYQMSSTHDPKAAAADPENRLFWRMNVRRIEAEAIRDSLLAVAGRLDRSLGGSLLTVDNRAYFFDHTSKDLTRYDTDRRSLYLPVVRNHLYDVFQLFDAPDASVPVGDRETTTVAPQALFLMNSGLVMDLATDLASDLRDRADLDDTGRVALLFDRALGRPPTASESERALDAIGRLADDFRSNGDNPDDGAIWLRSWSAFCQVILSSDEFVTIR